MELKEGFKIVETETNKLIKGIVSKIQIYGFWFLMILALGFGIGVTYCNKTQSNYLKDSIQIGGFIYNNEVFEIKKKILQ